MRSTHGVGLCRVFCHPPQAVGCASPVEQRTRSIYEPLSVAPFVPQYGVLADTHRILSKYASLQPLQFWRPVNATIV